MKAKNPAKLILEVSGWKILADTMQFIVKKGDEEYYFTALEACLFDIVKMEGDKKLKDKGLMEIKDAIKILVKNKESMIEEINKALLKK